MHRELPEIKQLRKKLGLSQAQLARLASVSQSLVAKIEANRIDPTYTKATKLFEVLEHLGEQEEVKGAEIMNPKIISLKPSDSVKDAVKKMRKYDISQLPVIDNELPIGMVSEALLLNALIEKKADSSIKELMEDAPPIISSEASVKVISSLLRYSPMVLISSKGKLKGVVTKSDILKKMLM